MFSGTRVGWWKGPSTNSKRDWGSTQRLAGGEGGEADRREAETLGNVFWNKGGFVVGERAQAPNGTGHQHKDWRGEKGNRPTEGRPRCSAMFLEQGWVVVVVVVVVVLVVVVVVVVAVVMVVVVAMVVVVVATLILFLRRGERAKIKRSFRRLKQRGTRCACVDLFASAVAQVEQEVRDMGTNRL